MLEHVQLGLSLYQVTNKHKVRVKEMIKRNGELSRDLFFSEQDIRNMAGKLTKKTHRNHENDAQSLRM